MGNIEANLGPQCGVTLNFGLMNARSAVNKAALIHDVIADYKLDLALITESWITSDTSKAVRLDIAPAGYRVSHAHRGSSKDKGGGGIAIVHRESVNVFAFNAENYCEFESATVTLSRVNSSVILVSINRPLGHVSIALCEQLLDLFDKLLLSRKHYLICRAVQ